MRTCSIDGCKKPYFGRGWCNMHYSRWRRNGDPLDPGSWERLNGSVEERLWARVDKSGGPDACWPWTGNTRHPFGYGVLHVNRIPEGAHRVAYRVTYGEIPEDKPYICHACDNPPCCNPAHLFAGTQADNLDDMAEKDRAGWYQTDNRLRGPENNRTKLTEDQVREIRRLAAEGLGQRPIARRFGIGKTTVRNILRGVTWTHVD